jgi:hypothetical protein
MSEAINADGLDVIPPESGTGDSIVKNLALPECEPKLKRKSTIFRFNGDKPTAINLAHVTNMVLDGKRITFSFYSTATYIEMVDESTAITVFEVLLNNWSAEPEEE